MSEEVNNFLNFDVNNIFKNLTEGKKTENEYGKDIYRPNSNMTNLSLTSYSSVIKFIPWFKDTNSSIVEKYVTFLKDPIKNENRCFDCPSSINKQSIFQTSFFACRNSARSSIRDLEKSFRRTGQFFALIQVIEDEKCPENEGQIKIFQFPKQIFDKLNEFVNPTSKYKKPENPFDIFSGKLFNVKIRIKTDRDFKFPTYEMSEFLDREYGIVIDGKEYKDKEDLQKIYEYLKTNSPDLDQYKYKEMTSDQKSWVGEAIRNILPEDCAELKQIMKKHPDFFVSTKENDGLKNIDDDSNPFKQDEDEKPVLKPKQSETVKQDLDDELDDIIDIDDILND